MRAYKACVHLCINRTFAATAVRPVELAATGAQALVAFSGTTMVVGIRGTDCFKDAIADLTVDDFYEARASTCPRMPR